MKTKLFLIILFLQIVFAVSAQTTSDTVLVRIETLDGNEFIGTIVSEDNERVVLKTENFGEINILQTNIKSKKEIQVQQIKDGKLWFTNPQSTRYFWAPNAYGLKKGEGYYQNIWVLWNQFAYGLTDNFSIGGGVIPLFLFGGAPTPVFATAKFSTPAVKEKFNISVGAIAGTVLGESNTGIGMVYGLGTLGSHDSNVTFGVGYGFSGEGFGSTPAINFSGMFRVSSRSYFITENYLIVADGEAAGFISLGGRSIIKKVAFDYGLFIPASPGMDTFIALPWLGFTIPFGI
ncbi:MAG: hypothetical protein R2757_12820 [Draconibacterium sp.]